MREHKIRFIKKSIIFLVILIALIFLINNLYVEHVFKKKLIYRSEMMYQEYIENASKSIDFAFFGDSHAKNGANPLMINNSFNFGVNGETYLTIYYKLRRIVYIDKVNIDNIVLEIDPHIFLISQDRPLSNFMNDLHYYSNYLNYEDIKDITSISYAGFWLHVNFPFIGNIRSFEVALRPELTEIYLGWVKNHNNLTRWNQEKRDIELKKTTEMHFREMNIDKPLFRYFLATLKLAKNNNITVILIKYPLTNDYIEAAQKLGFDEDEHYRYIFKAAESILGNDYIVVDYEDMFINQSYYFGDFHHLNYAGAEEFSKRFYNDLILYNITDRPKHLYTST